MIVVNPGPVHIVDGPIDHPMRALCGDRDPLPVVHADFADAHTYIDDWCADCVHVRANPPAEQLALL